MRFFATKRSLVVALGLLTAMALLMAFAGCIRIPVTVHPERDDKDLPVALPVTPVGSVTPEGVLTPVYPVSIDAPKPPAPFPWGDLLGVGLSVLGVAGGGYGLLAAKVAAKAKSALAIACQLADAHARSAEDAAKMPPEEADKALLDIERNKMIAAQQQAAAGVLDLVKQVRGK